MSAVRTKLKRMLRWCLAPFVRRFIRKFHQHAVLQAPLQPKLEEALLDLRSRMQRLEKRSEDLDLVLHSLVRELLRLQVQTENVRQTLTTLEPTLPPPIVVGITSPTREPNQHLRHAG
jgi:hypothetical protein